MVYYAMIVAISLLNYCAGLGFLNSLFMPIFGYLLGNLNDLLETRR